MKRIFVLFICASFIAGTSAWAQIDEEKMQRDLEISKNILETLLKQENRHMMGHGIEASYVEGFGVILTVPGRDMSFYFNFDSPNVTVFNDVFGRPEDQEFVYEEEFVRNERGEEREISDENSKERIVLKKEKEKRKHLPEEERTVVRSYSYVTGAGGKAEDNEEQKRKSEEAIITFLADYADLIGQLQPDDKIMVKRKATDDNFAIVWSDVAGTNNRNDTGKGMSITANKKDIIAYRSGKIGREEFEERLTIEREIKKEEKADLEIFGTIFRQYFNPGYSKTFFIGETPEYELLEGVGVIFYARTYSSFRERDQYYLPSTGEKVDNEERNARVQSLYPEFIQDLKELIVDYGRTIRSLAADEKLMMKIEVTKCADCGIPKAIEATVPISVLMNYDQQKISREKALAGVAIKEVQ